MLLDGFTLTLEEPVGLRVATQPDESLRPAQCRVNSKRPRGIVDGFKLGQRLLEFSAQDCQTGSLERDLPVEDRQRSVDQVLGLCAEPLRDDLQDPDRGIGTAFLNLVDERSAEVSLSDLGEAHPPFAT